MFLLLLREIADTNAIYIETQNGNKELNPNCIDRGEDNGVITINSMK